MTKHPLQTDIEQHPLWKSEIHTFGCNCSFIYRKRIVGQGGFQIKFNEVCDNHKMSKESSKSLYIRLKREEVS